jgi:uncharacterized repeat protein (TIGR02543 family)
MIKSTKITKSRTFKMLTSLLVTLSMILQTFAIIPGLNFVASAGMTYDNGISDITTNMPTGNITTAGTWTVASKDAGTATYSGSTLTLTGGGAYCITQTSGTPTQNIVIDGTASTVLYLESISTTGYISAPDLTGSLFIILRGENTFTSAAAIPINAPNATVYIFGDPTYTEADNTLTATTGGNYGIKADSLEVDHVDSLSVTGGISESQDATTVTISGVDGNVTISGGDATGNSYGIYSSGNVSISNIDGTVLAKSGDITTSAVNTAGIIADENVTIDDSFVQANVYTATTSSVGIASPTLTFKGKPQLMMQTAGKAFEITTFTDEMTAGYTYNYAFADDTQGEPEYAYSLDQYAFTSNSDKKTFALRSQGTSTEDPDTQTTSDGFKYILNASGTKITITGYTGALTEIVIPSVITVESEDLPVTAIGEDAFNAEYEDTPNTTYKALTSITVPDSVTTIGLDAFRYCSALTTLTLGGGITSIGTDIVYADMALATVNYIKNTSAVESYDFNSNTSFISTKTIAGVKVAFNTDEGEWDGSNPTGIYLLNAELPINIEKEGYTFEGWYTAAEEGTQIEEVTSANIATIPATLYARWTALPVAATGVDLTASQTVDTGSTISLTATASSIPL